MSDTEIQAAITALFPDDVAVSFSTEPASDRDLLPEELDHTGKMVNARRLEFAQGRRCARTAMEFLGFPSAAIPVGANREPVWPEGITGSVSHTNGSAAAVVGHTRYFAGLGLDMESDAPLGEDLVKLICRPDEDAGQGKLLFSIKEAIYKCIYPTVQAFVDFQEMKVAVDADAQTYLAEAHSPACDRSITDRLEGRFVYAGDLVISSAWLPAKS